MKTGQKVVTTAGTAVPLGNEQVSGPIMIKALDTNTGIISVGNDGTGNVTMANGVRLVAGQVYPMSFVNNLSAIMLNSTVNGEGVSWGTLETL